MARLTRNATRKWSSQPPAESTTCNEHGAEPRASLGAVQMTTTLPGAAVPGAGHSNIVDAVSRPTFRNPGKGRRVNGPERGRSTQAKLNQGTMEQRTTMVLLLAQAAASNRLRDRRTKADISIHKHHNIRLPCESTRQIIPPQVTGGSINARVWSMSNNSSTLQAPGSNPNRQDSRGRVDGNKIKLPEAIVLPVNTGIRILSTSP